MSLLLNVLLALVLVYLIMMLIAGPNRTRMRALKRSHPTSLILTAVTPRGSQVAGQELMRAYAPLSKTKLPTWMAITVDPDAMRFWSGGRKPKLIFQSAWGQIRSIRPAMVQESERTDRALELQFVLSSGIVTYPLVILGNGMLGLFPKSDTDLAEISEQLKRRIVST